MKRRIRGDVAGWKITETEMDRKKGDTDKVLLDLQKQELDSVQNMPIRYKHLYQVRSEIDYFNEHFVSLSFEPLK